jgi:hypothetical protein
MVAGRETSSETVRPGAQVLCLGVEDDVDNTAGYGLREPLIPPRWEEFLKPNGMTWRGQ